MPLIHRLFSVAQSSVLIGMLAIVGIAQVHAAKPPPTPLSCSISPADGTTTVGVPITFTGSTQGGKGQKTYSWDFSDGGGVPAASTETSIDVTYSTAGGPFLVSLDVTDKQGEQANCTTHVTVEDGGGPGDPSSLLINHVGHKAIAEGGDLTFTVHTSGGLVPPVTLSASSLPAGASFTDNGDGTGTFDWPNAGPVGSTLTTFTANDAGTETASETVTITVAEALAQEFLPQTDFKIMMNYELGMHCTGFEFAYCCVLPVYNSILAQVVKPTLQGVSDPQTRNLPNGGHYPMLLEGDPNEGLDALGRETVVRDKSSLDAEGNFKKYVLKYWHEAQPRNDGRGKAQTSTQISAVEGNSLMAWNTTFDSARVVDGALQYEGYNGSEGVMAGDGDFDDPTDNYQNAVWNHLYFYNGLEGEFACSAPAANAGNRCSEDADCDSAAGGDGVCNITSDENQKIRLGVSGQPGPFLNVAYPADCGPAFHPMGPVTQDGDPANDPVDNNCGGFAKGNVLTFSGNKGTVVYTQMKVLENLPVMLTSPRIWEALGLPLTPFEDSIDFFADPGLVDEDSVRPFVVMKAQMHDYDPDTPDGAGAPTMVNGNPVVGFGTAPIDIPNCERCHSNPANGEMIANSSAEGGGLLMVGNSPNGDPAQYALVEEEYNFWSAYYSIDRAQGDSDWYARLKSAAISMLYAHDVQHGTGFADCYPYADHKSNPECKAFTGVAQNTRLGHESVICQRCHADNVIAAVKSASCGAGNADPLQATESCEEGTLIKPITEAVHNNHRGVSVDGPIAFSDSLGRDGGCQGCHPAHRSNGDMNGYPITLAGTNYYENGDNRGASGGCFVGRDVHSNPGKDTDGAETAEHLNAVGQYLADFVSNSPTENTGIWCTNCHSQLGQEMWKAENMEDLVHGVGANNIRAGTLQDIADQVAGGDVNQVKAWLDPTDDNALGDFTYAIWDPDPGLCDYVDNELFVNVLIDNDGDGVWDDIGLPSSSAHDGNVATIEVHAGGSCSPGYVDGPNLATAFGCGTPATLCGKFDTDGDFSVHVMDFCTTLDCVNAAQATLTNSLAVPVPFSAATDGRDHWLSAGEPHCADCHAAPYVEQSGNIDAFPPFNYPRKASLMRYSRGHQDISCQGCHESIHGLYPVTPNTDTTTYAQAAALNHDGSHGPLKCGTCHDVDDSGIPIWMSGVRYNGNRIRTYDEAVSWAHTFTAEVSPLEGGGVCENCHGDRSPKIKEDSGKWLRHSFVGRVGRAMQDKAEIAALGDVAGGSFVDADDLTGLTTTVCSSCHSLQGGPSGAFADLAICDNITWKSHLVDGRLAEKVWEFVTRSNPANADNPTCGW